MQIAGYQIGDPIGVGGMATVYQGIQESLNRAVAVKVLSHNPVTEPDIGSYFESESLIIARLNHPNIIHIIDRGINKDGMPYFVMEHVEGKDLVKLIRHQSMDFNRKLDIIIQICKALSYAHKNGVIHRDIKPANILIDNEGFARVLDFGIARFYGDANLQSGVDETNLVVGTMSYMSPEQRVSANSVTIQSDLYSLGVVMYEMLVGKKPQMQIRAPSELDPSIPVAVDSIVLQCLQPDPTQRPASADVIKDRLLMVLRGAHLPKAQRERAGLGINQIKDKFALLDVIKEDKYGAVFLYENRIDHRLMVIKKRYIKSTGFRESKLLNSLKHPNIVNILGVSANDKLFILVMEYLSGGSLQDRLLNPFTLGDFLKIASQISSAMAFADTNRVIHGNLRPTNILFDEKGMVKVADFGLDEHYSDPEGEVNWYRSGEQTVSVGEDIFAAGVIFHQMLTGTLPKPYKKEMSVNKLLSRYPFQLQRLIKKMISLELDTRIGSWDQVTEAFEEIMSDAPTQKIRNKSSENNSLKWVDNFKFGFYFTGSLLLIGFIVGMLIHITGLVE